MGSCAREITQQLLDALGGNSDGREQGDRGGGFDDLLALLLAKPMCHSGTSRRAMLPTGRYSV